MPASSRIRSVPKHAAREYATPTRENLWWPRHTYALIGPNYRRRV
mgnify:CR=1 FL=1